MKIRKASTLFVCSLLILSILLCDSLSMADNSGPAAEAEAEAEAEAAVYIIYTHQPDGDDHFHIKTLTSVLGSEDAAKEALVYSYKHAASGFSAKLTPAQVEEMSKQPGVVQVVPSRTLQLHSGPGRLNV